jgi:hypothetical protein
MPRALYRVPNTERETLMRHVNAIGRLGVLAIGLGIGAAVSSTGTASADDFQISIDGFDLFPTAGNTAIATSGMGDMAIAIGPHSEAFAGGGFGDVAIADGTGNIGAFATAGDPAAGASGSNFDFASASGNDIFANAGNAFGVFPDTTGSSFDFASALGFSSVANAGGNGSGDYASAVGEAVRSTAGSSSNAANPANFDSASVLGNLFTSTTNPTEAIAGGVGNGLGGSNDVAFVNDLFGTLGSSADAGSGHIFDLAGALGDNLNAVATSGDFLAQILPFF